MNKNNSVPLLDEQNILVLRGRKLILDAHAAKLLGVSTQMLLRAVNQNLARFPKEFMIRLNKSECKRIALKGGELSRYIDPKRKSLAFTPHGFFMLSGVLKSDHAVALGIFIVRSLYASRIPS